jgi:hypothetical protein
MGTAKELATPLPNGGRPRARLARAPHAFILRPRKRVSGRVGRGAKRWTPQWTPNREFLKAATGQEVLSFCSD